MDPVEEHIAVVTKAVRQDERRDTALSTPGAGAGNPDGGEAQGESPYRLFVALAVAEPAKEHISYVQRDVGRLLGSPFVMWEPPENFHISLRFLGDTPGRRVSETIRMIRTVASDHAPFYLQTGGLGVFTQDSRPRVLHLKAGPKISPFLGIQEALESAVQGLGFWLPADFPFTPHVTIGRIRRDQEPADHLEVDHSLATLAVDARMGPSWTVTRVGLYVSEFVNERPVYRRLGEAALKGTHEE